MLENFIINQKKQVGSFKINEFVEKGKNLKELLEESFSYPYKIQYVSIKRENLDQPNAGYGLDRISVMPIDKIDENFFKSSYLNSIQLTPKEDKNPTYLISIEYYPSNPKSLSIIGRGLVPREIYNKIKENFT